MARCSVNTRCLLAMLAMLAMLLPLQVLSQDLFDLSDALDKDQLPASATAQPGTPAATAAGGDSVKPPTTKAPPKVVPRAPAGTKAPAKPKPKPAADDLNLADALDPNNDIGGKDRNKGQGGGFSDSDLVDIGKDDTYKPDKGKGGRPRGDDEMNHQDDNGGTTAEVGTLAGIVSAVAVALVGAVTSYISYQKKKLCFGIQQSLNTDMVKAENPEAVVATEPQVQQTLLEPPSEAPPTEENAV